MTGLTSITALSETAFRCNFSEGGTRIAYRTSTDVWEIYGSGSNAIRRMGDMLVASFANGAIVPCHPVGGGTWIGDPSIEVSPTSTPPDPTPDPAGTIYNPWSSYPITGTWQDHMSYSLGGIDYPLPYGTAVKAPTAGILHTSGGSGDYETGWVGSAGRRSILYLDTDFPRINPHMEQKEGTGPMHAIVFQHQSSFGTDRQHYSKGDTVGHSGASADGADYGGDVHLHVHGLTAGGSRVDFLNFIP